MNQKDRKIYEKILLEKREELLKELGLIEESNFNKTTKDASGDISSYAFHLADQASDFQEREKAFHFASREGRYLHHIEEALRRVKEKDYGLCFECGKEIDPDRLKAVPHARLCINCKSKEEDKKRKSLE
jgi:RNA polymerase-binding protein DksA